jgi:hypothetical protein
MHILDMDRKDFFYCKIVKPRRTYPVIDKTLKTYLDISANNTFVFLKILAYDNLI